MKQNIIIGLLALTLAGLFTITNKAPAQGNPNQAHQVVFLGVKNHFRMRDDGSGYAVSGLAVDWVEASPGCPAVSVDSSLSAAIAFYMNLGFTHEALTYGTHLLKK